MTLKVYCNRMSQPSRAILIFCKMNGIDFEEITIILKGEQHTPEYKGLLIPEYKGLLTTNKYVLTFLFYAAINPMCQVPTIVDGDFTLFERFLLLLYLLWYPSDLVERAKVHSVLDWHHANLRHGSGNIIIYINLKFPTFSIFLLNGFMICLIGFMLRILVGAIVNNVILPQNGLPSNPQAAEEVEKTLEKALTILETFWLKDGPFLVGRSQPSIADLYLVSEVMELELLSEELHDRILSPYKKVLQWVEDTKSATAPHFEEIHGVLFKMRKEFRMTAKSGKTE
ncbi:putative glutathione transferase [Helianthus annuus]|nr:putative glutathione transferase [Helianthus annuus]KAJ0670367.1 putative glutathione transferase [Helianthus annuus]